MARWVATGTALFKALMVESWLVVGLVGTVHMEAMEVDVHSIWDILAMVACTEVDIMEAILPGEACTEADITAATLTGEACTAATVSTFEKGVSLGFMSNCNAKENNFAVSL